MAQHARLKIDAGMHVYFCDPQSPWQRGTNENTNGLLRQYFPKGTDLTRIAPTHSRPLPQPQWSAAQDAWLENTGRGA
jgi:IS30 family transposase